MLTMIRHHDDTYAYEPLTRRWSTPRLDYEQAPAHEKLDLHTRVAAASVRTAVITGLAAGILHHIPILNHANQVVVHLTLPGRQQPATASPPSPAPSPTYAPSTGNWKGSPSSKPPSTWGTANKNSRPT